jgi:hypothetical protein
MIRFLTRAVLSSTLMAISIGAAQAFPPFAKKEEKKCAYCHTSPAGGKRNYRGLFYKANMLTFANFDDAAEAKKAGVEIGAEPDPKPKSWTAPKTAEAPKAEAPKAPEAPQGPNMAELKKKADAAAMASKKAPKDAKLKMAHAQALAEYGEGMTRDSSVPPVKRYPEALKIVRAAKALDPKNVLALKTIKDIEDAYTSMGRPIPK